MEREREKRGKGGGKRRERVLGLTWNPCWSRLGLPLEKTSLLETTWAAGGRLFRARVKRGELAHKYTRINARYTGGYWATLAYITNKTNNKTLPKHSHRRAKAHTLKRPIRLSNEAECKQASTLGTEKEWPRPGNRTYWIL